MPPKPSFLPTDVPANPPSAPLSPPSSESAKVGAAAAAATTDTCTICLSAITDRAVALPCAHLSFDFACLVSWLEVQRQQIQRQGQQQQQKEKQQRPRCPLCKAPVTEVQYDFAAHDDYSTYVVPRSSGAPSRSSDAAVATATATIALARRRPHQPTARHAGRDSEDPDAKLQAAIQRRRYIYRHKLYSLHVGRNRHSGTSVLSPALIAGSASLQSRARAFIRRELFAFPFLLNPTSSDEASTSSSFSSPRAAKAAVVRHHPNPQFLISYTLSILRNLDIKGSSGAAEDMLAEILGRENARLFCHELGAWLGSPYQRLEEWDEVVQYPSVCVKGGEFG